MGSRVVGFVEGTSKGRISARFTKDPPTLFNLWRRQDFDLPAGTPQDGGRVWEHWCTLRDIRPAHQIGTSALTAYVSLTAALGDHFVPTVARGRREYGHPVQLREMVRCRPDDQEGGAVGRQAQGDTGKLRSRVRGTPILPHRSRRQARSIGRTRLSYYMFKRKIALDWSKASDVTAICPVREDQDGSWVAQGGPTRLPVRAHGLRGVTRRRTEDGLAEPRVGQVLRDLGVVVFDPWNKPEVQGLHDYGLETAESAKEAGEMDVRRFAGGRRGTGEADRPLLGNAAYRSADGRRRRFPHRLLPDERLQRRHRPRDRGGPAATQTRSCSSAPLSTSRPSKSSGSTAIWLRRSARSAPKARGRTSDQAQPARPSQPGYMPLVGGESFFDGFGFASCGDIGGARGAAPTSTGSSKRPPVRAPLLPFLAQTRQEACP